MSNIRLLLVSLIVLALGQRAAAQTPLEILPQDAAVAIAIRDLDDLIAKGDKFLMGADIRLPLRPSELFDMGAAFLGVRNGLDRKAAAAIVLMPPEREDDFNNFRFVETNLVPILPFTNADVMADNFGIGKGRLQIMPTRTKVGMDPFVKYASATKKHIHLCGSDKTLERIHKSKSVSDSATPDQRNLFAQSDVFLHFGRYFWSRNELWGGDGMINLGDGNDPREKEFAQQFTRSLKEVQNTVFGFRLHEGIDGHMLLTIPKDGEAAKLFKSLKGKGRASTLKGLPEGKVLAAQAASGDGAHQSLLVKTFFRLMMEEWLFNQKIIHHVDRLTYLGVFQEVLGHLQGHRLGIYQNLDERKHGLFCAIAVLDCDDAKFSLQAMRILSKMASADTLDWSRKEVKEEFDIDRLVRDLRSSVYAVRQSANTKLALIGEPALPPLTRALDADDFDLESKRRARDLRDRISAVAAQRRKELLDRQNHPLFLRPKMTFVANAEKRQGQNIDVISLKIDGAGKADLQQYAQLLGPDWDKVRLAIVGNQIVVMLGSETTLFDAAVKNVQKGEPGLAASKRLSVFHEQVSKHRQFELHASVEGIWRLIAPDAKLDTPAEMTSLALTLGEQSLQVDARMPMPEVRLVARKSQEQFR